MGYFPNNTAAEIFQTKNCYHCRHWDKKTGCPVWNAHMIYNYDDCNNPQSILHMLIPKEENDCYMFMAFDDNRCRETVDMFEDQQ